MMEEKRSIQIANNRIEFRMRANSRIKRSRLVVSPEEGLVVETPTQPTLRRAHKMIYRRKNWVLDALEDVRAKHDKAQEIKKHKTSVLVLGKEKLIKVRPSQKKEYILETKNYLILGFTQSHVTQKLAQQKVTHWLKIRSQQYLPLRVRQLSRQQSFKINGIVIKDQKTLWGSCTSEGNLNLNWRLMMAPRFAGDYIIMHELCHTRHLNHSSRFWKTVEGVCPHYEKAEKWFHDFGFVLHMNPAAA
jgi:predicted metal-dependent hydrolase